jgi:penicillin-binding protein 2
VAIAGEQRSRGHRRPLAEPLSVVDAPFLRSAGFYWRIGVLSALSVAAFAVLGLRLWSLQLIQGGRFAGLAQRQSHGLIVLAGPRGIVVDREGRLLAGTQGRLVLSADPLRLGLVDERGSWRPSASGRRTLARLGRIEGVSFATLRRRIDESLVRSPHAPAALIPSVPRSLAFYLQERPWLLPGLSVRVVPERSYPQGALGSEFLGLLGQVSGRELHERRYRGTRAGDVVGQSGVEAGYDRVLRGAPQRERVPLDALGRVAGRPRPLPSPHPPPGLQLTIDARLQRAAVRAVKDGIRFAHRAGHPDAAAGAAVVMDARTGALYALASVPGFNQLLAAREPAYLGHLLRRPAASSLLVDRSRQGLYPTGSTFKPIVAEAALASGLITPASVLPCTGSLRVGDTVFHNVEPAINASLTLGQALEISCDTWFYRLGVSFYARQQAGHLDMQRWARLLGLGHPTGLDLPGESGGVVPTPAWLRRTFHARWARIWYEGTSVNLSIGQGYLAVTPLQLAVAYAALANGGTVVRPHVARAVIRGRGGPVRLLRFPPRRRVRLVDAEAIRAGLYAAAHAPGGTSSAVFGRFPVAVAGKTGTAQTPSGSDHSWYASWAPAGRPRYVVVVLIEHGGFGVEAAAPAAREIYSALFGLRR